MAMLTIGRMLLIWMYIASVVTFAFFTYDKHQAFYHRWRVPEFLLLSLAFLGGAFGAMCSMLMFRHKTKHKSFTICVPVFLVVQILLVVSFRLLFL